jgi:hypothetical protein
MSNHALFQGATQMAPVPGADLPLLAPLQAAHAQLPPLAPLPAAPLPVAPMPVPPRITPPTALPSGEAARRYVTFNQLYADEQRDPCSRRYERIMARFDAEPPNALAGGTLFDQVVSVGGAQLQAYLCCGTGVGANGPRVYCVHSPSKFISSLDGTPSAWDSLSFAFLGELVQGAITNVLFHDTAFEEINVNAYTVPYMLEHLGELTQDSPLFPPVQPNEDNTQAITTRRFIYLPTAYVPLFLNAGGYTLRQVWERLHPAIVHRQEEVICQPLLKWLQAASMGTALNNPQAMGDPSVALPLVAPPADEALLTHRLQVLHALLPGLTAPPQSLETALSHMATAILTQTNDNRVIRDQRTAEDLEPKLPSKRFSVTLPVLLEYLQITDERLLPDVWHKWANCTKKQDFQVLRDTLEAFARSTQAFSTTVPVVSAKLVQDLLSFNFVGDSADDTKLGFHPFIISDGNAEHRQINREVARLYGYLQAGDTSVSLGDLEALQAKEVRSVPLTYWELEKNLGAFGNLMGVVLGLNHPLTAAYRDMWHLLQSGLRDDLHSALEYRAYVKPVHFLRSIQLTCYTWFTHRRNRLTPPTPDFKAIPTQIIMQLYVLPHLPPALYALAYPKKQTPWVSGAIPDLIASGSASNSSSGGTPTTGHSDASTVSGLTTPTPTKPPPSGRGAYMANLNPVTSLTALDRSAVKIKDLIGTTTPPKTADGTEMCLSFHLRGGCWSNCRRAANHINVLTTSDIQKLHQYVTRRLAAITPAPTPAPTIPSGPPAAPP